MNQTKTVIEGFLDITRSCSVGRYSAKPSGSVRAIELYYF